VLVGTHLTWEEWALRILARGRGGLQGGIGIKGQGKCENSLPSLKPVRKLLEKFPKVFA